MIKNKHAIYLLIALLMLTTLACNLGFQNGNITLTITLKRDNLMQLINSAQGIAGTVSDTDLIIEVQDVQFIEPDKVRLTGFYGLPNATRVNGEIELTFSVDNDQPKVEISWVNIPGLDLASDFVKNINEKLSGLLRDQIAQSGENALIKAIYVKDEAVKIDVEVPVRR
ncbi:MAG: hypothetical protein CVU41_00685 [Chloroflexi bacterium HGW-Chloroflexi-3]|nr:MAG: hypothetical protein CVU41_00685 [Chloroflexi bacterium HGW-Chloroflexi-3]